MSLLRPLCVRRWPYVPAMPFSEVYTTTAAKVEALMVHLTLHDVDRIQERLRKYVLHAIIAKSCLRLCPSVLTRVCVCVCVCFRLL